MPKTSVAAACRKNSTPPVTRLWLIRLVAEHRPDHELVQDDPRTATITTAAAIAAISGQGLLHVKG